MFALYVPLCRRYYKIAKEEDDLGGWWLVVAIRVGLAVLTRQGIVERGCRMGEYGVNLKTYLESRILLSLD